VVHIIRSETDGTKIPNMPNFVLLKSCSEQFFREREGEKEEEREREREKKRR